MQRIAQLPKSYQLNLTGERQYLQDARSSMQAAVNVDDPEREINPEEIRARL